MKSTRTIVFGGQIEITLPTNCLECCAMSQHKLGGGHGEGHWWEYKCSLLGRQLSNYGKFQHDESTTPEDCPFNHCKNGFSLCRAV